MLLEEMLKKPQRETAGADTSLRFDYQKNWAFCRMIRRHLEGADYLVAFEYHDDVVFMEPNENPSNVDFCQVKTKKGTSSVSLGFYLGRTKAKHGKKPSILGKMYENFNGIGAGHAVKTILVSNVPFSFCTKVERASDLTDNDVKKIKDKLSEEIPGFDSDRLKNMYFLPTGVSLDAMHSFLLGEVSELFKAELGEEHGLNMHAWTRVVQDDISRRNNVDSDSIGSTEELKKRKCIDRSFISSTIKHFADNVTRPPDISLVHSDLSAAGWESFKLFRLAKMIPNAVSDCTNPDNEEASHLKLLLQQHFETVQPKSLSEFIESALKHRNDLTKGLEPYSEESYFSAFAVIVFNEQI